MKASKNKNKKREDKRGWEKQKGKKQIVTSGYFYPPLSIYTACSL